MNAAEARSPAAQAAQHTSATRLRRPAAFCTSVAGYTFHAGMTSQRYYGQPELPGTSAVQLAAACDAEMYRMWSDVAPNACGGFTTDGVLKQPESLELTPLPQAGPCDGTFVRAAPQVPDCTELPAGGGLYCSYCYAIGARLVCQTRGTSPCKVHHRYLPRPTSWGLHMVHLRA